MKAGNRHAIGNCKKANVLGFVFFAVLFALSTSAEAQQPAKLPRIGILTTFAPSVIAARIEGFRQGLRELGYVEGKNIVIEWPVDGWE